MIKMGIYKTLAHNDQGAEAQIERKDRKCFTCDEVIEDEIHFITKCPLYSKESDNTIGFSNFGQ